ncbi:MAG: GxxExxY protein [Planctomycetaceae bacterium]
MALEHEDLTAEIIGAAIEVHKTLGPGFLESIYENALVIEPRKCGLDVHQQLEIPVYYDGIQVGQHRQDILVENTIVVELKAVKAIEDVHFATVRSYLKAQKLRHGLILNFSATKLQPKRVILNDEW